MNTDSNCLIDRTQYSDTTITVMFSIGGLHLPEVLEQAEAAVETAAQGTVCRVEICAGLPVLAVNIPIQKIPELTAELVRRGLAVYEVREAV